MERLLTTEDVADLLRLEPVTVRRLVARGELSAYRIAGEYRFTPAGVKEFVESQRVEVAGPNHPGSRFTDHARNVLSLAKQEAQRYQHDAVGTEHVLLAIMSEGEGRGAKALNQLQVQPGTVRKQIETQHPAGARQTAEVGMTPGAKDGVELAVQEARRLGHHYIGTEHLLLGLLREDAGLGGRVLRTSGITLDTAREVVKQVLATEQTTSESESGAEDRSPAES